jgi:hypothetical protein
MFLIAFLLVAAPSPIAPLTASNDVMARGTTGVEFTLPGGGVPTVGFTYFLQDNLAVRADLGLNTVFSPSGTPATFSIGVGLRMYQFKRNNVALFLQPALAFGRSITGADGTEFISLSGGIGVEYFFFPNLSAGGVLALAFNIGNLGGPAGSSASTSLSTNTSGLFANIYF